MIKSAQINRDDATEDKNTQKPFLTVEEAQKILGISRVNMYNLIHTKGFPVIHISPRRYVIPTNKFYEWAENQICN
ncbi:MAG: Helix-turn-helix domain protein [Firmicutes bacterium ADurb.Bin419]|nr:MAG: Helix-turn-helix domain protein [Firmicutes bacterium ADurb.Bin419]